MRRLRLSRGVTDDDGQLAILILGFALVVALLITVVVNVSKVFLARRALSAAADGAALAAANALDESRVYSGQLGPSLPLSQRQVGEVVSDYRGVAGLDERFERFQVVSVSTDGVTATVTFRSTVSLAFVNLVTAGYASGVPVEATASSRSPVG